MHEENDTKSSSEILTELFGAFNARPPSSLNDEALIKRSRKKAKKQKKSKKKQKTKKHKRKRSSDDSSESNSSQDDDFSQDKKQKMAVLVDSEPQALDQLLDNILETNNLSITNLPLPQDTPCLNSSSNVKIKLEPSVELKIKLEPSENGQVRKSLATSSRDYERSEVKEEKEIMQSVFGEPITSEEQSVEKGKSKILIMPNLKNSSVFQETMRAVEEQRRQNEAIKAKYEDGELTNSSGPTDGEDDQKLDKGKTSMLKSNASSRRKRSDTRNDHYSSRKKRRRSRSRSKERSRSRDRKRTRSQERHTSYHHNDRFRNRVDSSNRSASHRSGRETSRESHRSSISTSSSRSRRRSKSRDRRKDRSHSHESNKERTQECDVDGSRIDKKRLFAIAKKNAVKLAASGIVSAENLKTITRGGKTVNELTEYCKKLSKREAGEDISDDDSVPSDSDDQSFHHPFQVRDRPNSIVMNIRNAINLPTRSFQEKAVEQSKVLRLQFPVSSGSTHRATENEWVPVENAPSQSIKGSPKTSPLPSTAPSVPSTAPFALMPPPPLPPMLPSVPQLSAVPPPLPSAPVFPVIQPDSDPTDVSPASDNISAIVSKRLDALRALQEDPNNRSAKIQMARTERKLEQWVKLDTRKPKAARIETGEFTGSTGAQFLTPKQLSSGMQAWAKKDQLIKANPVTGGMGMTLLQKMGWQPGEGLGKNKEGTLEPLRLEVKTDKKGLVALDETSWGSKTPNYVGPLLPTVKTLDGKHPVSLLNEFAARRRWGAPNFELAFECGPDHKKNFLFKVTVNGKEYKPSVASINKKQAKAECAALCLRALGLISGETNPS